MPVDEAIDKKTLKHKEKKNGRPKYEYFDGNVQERVLRRRLLIH